MPTRGAGARARKHLLMPVPTLPGRTGVPSQDTAGTYTYGDNPFFQMKARNSTL